MGNSVPTIGSGEVAITVGPVTSEAFEYETVVSLIISAGTEAYESTATIDPTKKMRFAVGIGSRLCLLVRI